MNSIKWLLIISGIAILHTAVEYEQGVSKLYEFFPLNGDVRMTLRGYVWRACIRLTMLCYFIREYIREDSRYQKYLFWMVMIQSAIVIEFTLTYNKPWFVIFQYPHLEIGLWHVLLIFIGITYGNLLWRQTQD